MESWKDLFGNHINIYLWVAILSSFIMFAQFDLDNKNCKIKIIILYVLFYLLAVCNVLQIRYLLLVFLCITLIFLEFIFEDALKKKILKRAGFYFLDYFYQIIYEYKFFYFFISIGLISGTFKNLLTNMLENMVGNLDFLDIYVLASLIISILILIIGVIKIINEEFDVYSFDEIKEKIDTIMPFSNFRCNTKLFDFSKILVYREDRSYFIRRNSYNWFSWEFVKYRCERVWKECATMKYYRNRILYALSNLIKIVIYMTPKVIGLLIRVAKRIFNIIFKVLLGKNSIGQYMRGYATIEMQLIRTFAVKHGYSLYPLRRKAYEIIYSKVFFTSLKENYRYYHYGNLEEYKYYLLYLYIMVAPIKMNGVSYRNILDLYGKAKLNDITIEEFYVWTYGLSQREIDESLIDDEMIEMFDMSEIELTKIIKKFC